MKPNKRVVAQKVFGLWLRKIRETRRVTDSFLARILNTHVERVRDWEDGVGAPALPTLMLLIYELDCDAAETNALFDAFADMWARGRA